MKNLYGNFWPDYAEESVDYAEKMPDYAEISKINKVVPSVVSGEICQEWICFQLLNLGKHPKLSNLVTSIQTPHQKMHGMPGG